MLSVWRCALDWLVTTAAGQPSLPAHYAHTCYNEKQQTTSSIQQHQRYKTEKESGDQSTVRSSSSPSSQKRRSRWNTAIPDSAKSELFRNSVSDRDFSVLCLNSPWKVEYFVFIFFLFKITVSFQQEEIKLSNTSNAYFKYLVKILSRLHFSDEFFKKLQM